MKIEFVFGIISGQAKRALTDYVDERLFKQRKQYDEYTTDVDAVELALSIEDLMIISEHFIVTVGFDSVIIDCN